MPFQHQVDRHATVTPDKPAFILEGEARSYGELSARSRAVSARIAALPGRPKTLPPLAEVDKLIALDLGNHLLFPELFLGATAGRNACAVLDPAMPAAQLEGILARLEPDLVVTGSPSSVVADLATGLGLRVEPVAAFDTVLDADRAVEPPKDLDGAGGLFLVGFTSGTTSQPKAYARSRASWRASLARSARVFGLEHAPATLCPGALAHGLALYAFAETLHCGGTFHTVRRWNADRVAAALDHGDIERLVAVPTMISSLAQRSSRGPTAFPSVRDVLTAGAKLDGKHVACVRRIFPYARLMEYYGASELGFVSVSTVHPPDPETPLHTVGKPFPGIDVHIRHAGKEGTGQGAAGTIYVTSDLVCDGYLWGDDGKAFRTDVGGATVGDIGVLEPNGALTILGREGGMVTTGGFNVYPAEVEAVLKGIDGVDEAVVLGIEDAHLGARLVAVLQGPVDGLEGLLAEATAFLPRYKIPRDFYRALSWPMTSSGKIARGQVAQRLRDGHYGPIDPAA